MAKIHFYYDGLCPLCSRQVAHYRKLDQGKAIDYLDISDGSLYDLAEDGISHADAMARLHVRGQNGVLYTGAAADVELWTVLPYYRHLVPIARLQIFTWQPMMFVLEMGYHVFAWLRPYLPKLPKKKCTTARCVR